MNEMRGASWHRIQIFGAISLPPSFRAFGVVVTLNLRRDDTSSNAGECQKLLLGRRPGKVPSVHNARFHCMWRKKSYGPLAAEISTEPTGDGSGLTRL
jgi:hypothetical protein